MNKFKKIGIAISLGIALFGGIWLASPSQAAGCNKFNVVYCGTNSMSELQTAYSRTEIKELYKEWYITSTMIQGGSNMREGVVDANGNITVDGRVVATNSITVQSKAGTRQPQPQRSYKTSNGYTYYQYPTGQSFVDGPKSYKMYAWFDNDGKFITGVIKDCGNPVWGTPTTPPVKPALTCDALQVTEISRNTFKFNVKATAKGGASITSYTYNFGDNNVKTTNSSEIQYTYAQEGSYKVTVTVNGKETSEVKRQSESCTKTVVVKPEPKTPVLACDVLQVLKIEDNTYKFVVNATAKDGASITSYTYDFGDGTTKTVNSSTIEHTYTKYGNFKVTVIVNGKENGEVKKQSPNCEKTIVIEPETKLQVCDLKTKKYVEIKKSEFDKSKYSTNPNDCKEAPAKITICIIDKKELREIKKEEYNESKHTTDLSKCKEVPTTPTTPTPNTPSTPTPSPELPQTGASDVIMSALGLGGLTTATIAYIASRRQM